MASMAGAEEVRRAVENEVEVIRVRCCRARLW